MKEKGKLDFPNTKLIEARPLDRNTRACAVV